MCAVGCQRGLLLMSQRSSKLAFCFRLQFSGWFYGTFVYVFSRKRIFYWEVSSKMKIEIKTNLFGICLLIQ